MLESTHKWYHLVFVFSFWLPSLHMIISKSIHIAANIMSLFSILKGMRCGQDLKSHPCLTTSRGDLWPRGRLAQWIFINMTNLGFPVGSHSKESACNAGDMGLIPGSGRSPGEGNDCPLEYCCLDNSKDRGAWQATVHGVTKSQTWLSN